MKKSRFATVILENVLGEQSLLNDFHFAFQNVLTETQDKAIRRTKELKEQCSLEQTAKAHLEGVLRNELEERDLIISTLNTKVSLFLNWLAKKTFSFGKKFFTSPWDFRRSTLAFGKLFLKPLCTM